MSITTGCAPQAVQREEWSGAPWPLGAHLDPASGVTTFAVLAPDAARVLLELYPAATGSDADFELDLEPGPDGVWSGAVAGLEPGVLYAYRCWGPNWDADPAWRRGGSAAGFVDDLDRDGNRFNPNKVLFDPYAREITHTPMSAAVTDAGHHQAAFTTGGMPYRGRPAREFDTGRIAPKGVLVLDETPTGRRPEPAANPAIYEAHVKNLTLHPSAASLGDLLRGTPGFERVGNVPDALRGTYAGAAHLAPYLQALGITSLELLPVHATDTDHAGDRHGSVNHWGYQTLAFFAPNRDYAFDQSPGGPTREFKAMVRAFHAAGIEVLLDVVYNHTAEGGHWYRDLATTAFTSLGGFGAATYYQLTRDHHLVDGATGTSNQLTFGSAAARQLVLDSLRYWSAEMGVDGFRFDLAPVLGRRPDLARRNDWNRQKRFFTNHPLLTSIRNLAVAEGFEIIAEPWDLWGYEVGNFPVGWLEWNGHFRDAAREFLKGDGNTGAFEYHFGGPALARGRHGRPKAVNFIDAHDGFTMMDLVSYTTKRNRQGFPFGPSDGGESHNRSWDSGQDQALRRTRWRNAWLTVFLGRGVPMVVSGDEYGRTQNGNNNPWNLNTVGVWNNWEQAVSNAPTQVPVDPADPQGPRYHDVVGTTDAPAGVNPLLTFARYVAHLQRGCPGLRHVPWGAGSGATASERPARAVAEAAYRFHRPDLGGEPHEGDRALSVRIEGASAGGFDYLLMLNMTTEPVRFTLPTLPGGRRARRWRRLVDTAPWAEFRGNCWPLEDAEVLGRDGYVVHPWSCALAVAR